MSTSERRVTLITGASSGIGATTARAAVRAGLDVALVARRKDSRDPLVAELGAERALALPCDATDFDQQARAVEAAVARFGGLDVAFANAGMVDTAFFDTPKTTKLKPEDIADAAMFAALAPPRANVREVFVTPTD